MGTKTLTRLFIALLVVAAVAVLVNFIKPGEGIKQVEASLEKEKVFDDFPINQVGKIEITAPDDSLTLTRGTAAWEVAEREGYPAEITRIVETLRAVWDLDVAQTVPVAKEAYGRLNLIDPTAEGAGEDAGTLISFSDGQGQPLASLLLGSVYERQENRPSPFGGGMATTDAGRYVKRGDQNFVYLVGNTFSDVELDPTEWISKEFFAVDGVQFIEWRPVAKENGWKLRRPAADADFVLADAKEGEELDQSKVAAMKNALSNASMEDVLTGDAVKPVDQGTFIIRTFDGFSYTIKVGEKNDLNEMPMTVKVTGKFKESRKEGEEESDEEKQKLDAEFAADLDALKQKLAREQKLDGHTFLVRSFQVDSLMKDRAELLVSEEEEAAAAPSGPGQEIAPGINLPE